MASLNLDYRRPCYAEGEKAMFHCWDHQSNIVPPSGLYGGRAGGQISGTFGIVEYEKGFIKRVRPEEIIFIDGGGFKEICFGDENNETI